MTTLLYPIEAASVAITGRRRRNVFTGFRRFDLPLLASYPRSGTNWIRYSIEVISGLPTPGQVRVHSGRDYAIDRAHIAWPIMQRHPSVLLVLRDYRECLLRHNHDQWLANPDVAAFLSSEKLNAPALWYVQNLRAFDEYEGPKLLLYYEDIVAEPTRSVQAVAAFLELDAGSIDTFIESIDDHYKRSVSAYTRRGHRSESTKGRDVSHHARTNLTPGQMAAFDDWFFACTPSLAERYLERYRLADAGSGTDF